MIQRQWFEPLAGLTQDALYCPSVYVGFYLLKILLILNVNVVGHKSAVT